MGKSPTLRMSGRAPDDPTGGYAYGVKSFGIDLNRTTGRQGGGDLRWSNLLNGLVFGSSFLNSPQNTVGTISMSPLPTSPYAVRGVDNTLTYFAQYRGKSYTGCRVPPRDPHRHDIDQCLSSLRSDIPRFIGRARLVRFSGLPRLEKAGTGRVSLVVLSDMAGGPRLGRPVIFSTKQ